MTALVVGGLVVVIVGVMLAVLSDVLRLMEISRRPYDRDESRG